MADEASWNSDGGMTPEDLTTTDLEQAYLRALEAMESADWAVPVEDSTAEPEVEAVMETDQAARPFPDAVAVGVEIAPHDFLGGPTVDQVKGLESPGPMTTTATEATPPVKDESVVPSRIIEACLFVGGHPWTAKKLAGVLEGNTDQGNIDLLIDELNLEYSAQGRPYEIRLGDGGYRLTLRPEFESIRSRVYGVGPRDVKLSQDVLEVLALVAYQQPITAAEVEAAKPNSANLLRQLLRRELIALNRIDETRKGVEYHTTPRFLQLFGLGQLSELPRPEDLSVR